MWFREVLQPPELLPLQALYKKKTRPGFKLARADQLNGLLDENSPLTLLARSLVSMAMPVRAVLYDKTAGVNWSMPWHQNRVVTVSSREDVPGFRNWNRKDGVWHAEAPFPLLENMIFAIIHLDETDGPDCTMDLALGSHKLREVDNSEAAEMAEAFPIETCTANPGDVVFVKALTLCRSTVPDSPDTCRRLRVDFSPVPLPAPLEWALKTEASEALRRQA